MIRKKLISIFVVTTMVAMIQTAQAAFVGTTDSLADLVNNNNSIGIGDKIFSDFSATDPALTGLTSYDPSGITVTASQVGNDYLLTWGGNISLVAGPGSAVTADLLLGYTVTATSGKIFAIDQNYTGSAQPAGGAYISIAETAIVPGGNGAIVASSILDETIKSSSFTAIGAILNPNEPILTITKDIGFGAFDGGFITVSTIVQSFDQVPEPTTMIAGALLLLPFGASTLRILRKNRTA